jgi:hypothetical protein
MDDSDTYGSIADYFNNTSSSGAKSQGKAGGTGSSAQQYAAPAPQTSGGSSGSTGGSDNTQGGNAQSGSDSWISAAVSQTSSDKSTFVTSFDQQFGGITNNQIINSAGAVGATTTSPIAPIVGATPAAGGGGFSFSPVELALAIFAGIALILYVRK